MKNHSDATASHATRRAFLCRVAWLGASAVGVGLLPGCAPPPSPSAAPVSVRAYRVGILSSSGRFNSTELRQQLAELGYGEDRVLVEQRWYESEGDDLIAQVTDLVGLPVDVMLVGGDPGIRAAMDATTSIPIVMLGGSTDPVGAGFAESLARPGKNVTGVLNPAPEAELKGLQLLTEAVPGIVRIAVLGPVPPAAWERASESLGVELLYATARSQDGYEAAFERTYTEGVDALVGRQAPGVDARFAATLARRYHLPSIYPARGYVAQGGLMSYAPRPSSMGLALANYVDRILRGAQPGDLPIDQPTRYDLIVNLRAAQDLGLTLPATFLARVDETIE